MAARGVAISRIGKDFGVEVTWVSGFVMAVSAKQAYTACISLPLFGSDNWFLDSRPSLTEILRLFGVLATYMDKEMTS